MCLKRRRVRIYSLPQVGGRGRLALPKPGEGWVGLINSKPSVGLDIDFENHSRIDSGTITILDMAGLPFCSRALSSRPSNTGSGFSFPASSSQ